jgi:hypothetical protein
MRIIEGCIVWQLSMPTHAVQRCWKAGELKAVPDKKFKLAGVQLQLLADTGGPTEAVQRILVKKQQRPGQKREYIWMGTMQEEVDRSDSYEWIDGKQIFETSTKHLRELMVNGKTTTKEPIGVSKWHCQLPDTPTEQHIWSRIWLPFREEKVNHCLWQISHCILATNRCVYVRRMVKDIKPEKVIADEDVCMNCSRCSLGVREDILHMQWSCADSVAAWDWITKLIWRAGALSNDFQFHQLRLCLESESKLQAKIFL